MPSSRRVAVALATLALAASELAAQSRADVGSPGLVWPEARLPMEVVEAVRGAQERPLPVYDDAGEVILLSEIEMEVDPSGAAGLFWGLLAGFSLGSAIGNELAPGECEFVSGGFRYYCSPQETALNSAYPKALAMLGGVLGAWIGWELDHVSFEEALDRIRARRRGGR